MRLRGLESAFVRFRKINTSSSDRIGLPIGWAVRGSLWTPPFFDEDLDETDCYASQLEDVRVWTSAHLDEYGELSDEVHLTADLGFARDVGEGEPCIEYPDEDLPCGTAPDHILNGGWYGLASQAMDTAACLQRVALGNSERRLHRSPGLCLQGQPLCDVS